MYKTMLNSKLHQIRVTDANLNYMGSITIDKDLMEKADIFENEKVQVVNIDNGARFETYVISGERGSKEVCLNGAAARLVQVGDTIIILSYVTVEVEKAEKIQPKLLFFDRDNNLLE